MKVIFCKIFHIIKIFNLKVSVIHYEITNAGISYDLCQDNIKKTLKIPV